MDSDAKYNKQQDDVVGSSQPTFLYDNNSYNLKPETIDDDGYFTLQDFQHLDHLIPSYGSSYSPDLGTIQQHPYAADDPFDLPPYGFFSNNNLSFYDAKPFAGMCYGGGGAMVVDAFHDGGVGFMGPSLPEQHGAGMISGGDTHRRMAGQQFSGYQQQEETLKPMSFVISDELSCTTVGGIGCGGGHYKNGIGTTSKGRAVTPETTRTTCNRRENKKPNNNIVKGQWTVEEDRLLIQLVDQYGVRKWSLIAQMLKGRVGKQCRERWHNHLRPNIKKDTWTEEEDGILIRAHEEIGNKWSEIAKRLPGRTENNIKNHWNATKRRQYSRRKCRSKFPRQSSLLQNYIKSLNLTSTASAPKHGASNNSPTPIVTKDKQPAVVMVPARATSHQHHHHHCRLEHFSNSISTVQTKEFCFDAANQLVSGLEFNDNENVPKFGYGDGILFQDQCSIDSLLDDIPPCGNNVDENESKDFEMVMMPLDHMASLMHFEVKKELDLVEMISQAS